MSDKIILKIGDSFSKTRTVTDELIRAFAEVSGDYNPIHLDEDIAAKTRFGQRIAHGMLSGAFISAVLGYELQERKIVYLSQTMKFVAPAFIGDEITTTAVVKNIREERGIVTLETTCTKQDGTVTVTGQAMVMIL
jgi:3-hydroxybutyryl-CoA dehydratase